MSSFFSSIANQTAASRPTGFGGTPAPGAPPLGQSNFNASQPAAGGGRSLFGEVRPPASQAFGASLTAGQQQPSLFATAPPAQQPTQAAFPAPRYPLPGINAPLQPPASSQTQGTTTSNSAFFDSLLQRSKKRPNEDEENGDFGQVPPLQLGLADIARRVRELGGVPSGRQSGKKHDSKAHYVLAGSGVTPGDALRELKELAGQQTAAASVDPRPSIDLDTAKYVASLQSKSTLAVITESLNRSARDFDAFLQRNVTMDWDTQRQRIYEHFGLVPRDAQPADSTAGTSSGSRDQQSFGRSSRRGRGQGDNGGPGDSSLGGSVFGASNLHKSVIGDPGPGVSDQATLFADTADKVDGANVVELDDRSLREKESRFIEMMQELNSSRIEGRYFPVFSKFVSVEAQNLEQQSTSTQLVNAYRALVEIVQEDPSAERVTDPKAVRERQFMEYYLDEDVRSARSTAMKRRIIDGSRQFLEKLFYEELEALITKFPREARMGGVPTTIMKIRAYVTLRSARKDLYKDMTVLKRLDDDFCWVIIFLLLRSGHVKEALEYVNQRAAPFRAIDRNFPTYLAAYYRSPDRRLPREMQSRIAAEYNQSTRVAPENSQDPYRIACYKVVGRCDLSRRHLEPLEQGVEDWMWLQFALAREVNRADEIAAEVFGLDEVRGVIREIGQRHFGKGQADSPGGHGTFFFLQILGGLFEEAVAYLYPYSYVSAVHFAIGLAFYGLLRVSESPLADSELLTYNTKQMPQISFGRMIGYYTRDFRSSNVEAATDYLTMLCLYGDLLEKAGKAQINLCHEALRELVLETREFAKLLGDIRSDGQRVPGAVEKRIRLIRLAHDDNDDDFLTTLTLQAAALADENGRATDAVLLYHLAGEYDKVISVVNRALSEAICVDVGDEPLKLLPLKAVGQMPAHNNNNNAAYNDNDATITASLSLTAVDDPAELARKMVGMYNQNALYYRRIRPANRDACGVLMRMSDARQRVEAGAWAEALDIISTLGILPLGAHGRMAVIRAAAQSFNNQQLLSPLDHLDGVGGGGGIGGGDQHRRYYTAYVSRTVGQLLTWTIMCCVHQRQLLRSSAFGGVGSSRQQVADELAVQAKDLMVFAGLIRYHLPPRVFETLARAGAEIESW